MSIIRSPLLWPLLAFLLIATALLGFWTARKINPITGDEPHYLVMASGLVHHRTFEQTEAYRDEFRTNRLSPDSPLAPKDAAPSPENTPAGRGPHGLYNVHGPGLPVLIALPLVIGGVVGVKLFMVLLAGAGLGLAGLCARELGQEERIIAWSMAAVGIGFPLVPASGQIYPDLVAGAFCLAGLHWFATTGERRALGRDILLAAVVAYLPWLQMKFAPAAAVLLVAAPVRIWSESRDFKRIATILGVGAISAAGLAAYNLYAFGDATGPYHAFHFPGIEFGKNNPMVFLGLLVDQNHGLLMQNPIHWIGLFSLGRLWREHRGLCVVWALVFLSLLIPNALHPVLYGAWSFSGRFAWAATFLFCVPTLYGLCGLAQKSRALFFLACGAGLVLQAYFLATTAFTQTTLYNRPFDTWPDAYPLFYYPFQRFAPMLYNADWAYRYLPNYAWAAAILLVGALGLVSGSALRRWAAPAGGTAAALVLGGGVAGGAPAGALTYPASALPSQAGRVDGATRVAEPGSDQPGYLDFGPYVPLRRGRYEATVEYSSPGGAADQVGVFDVYDSTAGRQMLTAPLRGTAGRTQQVRLVFTLGNWQAHRMELRNNWNGAAPIRVVAVRLRKF